MEKRKKISKLDRRRQSFNNKIRVIRILLAVAVFLGCWYYVLAYFCVKDVIVVGNKHYSAKEIEDIVLKGYWGDNALYLSLAYKNKTIDNIPLIERMDVDVVSHDTVKIYVYEKALAGYFTYLDRYMYFDHDGVIVDISKNRYVGIPEISGLKFDYAVLHENVPVERKEIFQDILNLANLLNKYEVNCDKIYFNDNEEVKLYYGNVKVDIGLFENLDEKIMQLKVILPQISSKKGTLDLKNYNSENTTISFKTE